MFTYIALMILYVLLIAWTIAIQGIWQQLESESRLQIIPVLRKVRIFKTTQVDERWYKGMSLMLFTYAMVRFLAVKFLYTSCCRENKKLLLRFIFIATANYICLNLNDNY